MTERATLSGLPTEYGAEKQAQARAIHNSTVADNPIYPVSAHVSRLCCARPSQSLSDFD
jgi:hypothetical protein